MEVIQRELQTRDWFDSLSSEEHGASWGRHLKSSMGKRAGDGKFSLTPLYSPMEWRRKTKKRSLKSKATNEDNEKDNETMEGEIKGVTGEEKERLDANNDSLAFSHFAADTDAEVIVTAVAQYGGPIAKVLIHSESSSLARQGSGSSRLGSDNKKDDPSSNANFKMSMYLCIYNSCGKLLHSIKWNYGNIAPGGLGWIQGGILCAVLLDGTMLLFVDHNFRLPPKIRFLNAGDQSTAAIALAHVWTGGVAALTEDFMLLCAHNLHRGAIVKVRTRLPVELFSNFPRAMTVLQPEVARSDPGNCDIALAHWNQGGVVVVSSNGSVVSHVPPPLSIPGGSSEIKASALLMSHPTSNLLASYGIDSKLVVVSTDFLTTFLIYDCGNDLYDARRLLLPLPMNMHWVGSSFAVCMVWKNPHFAERYSSSGALVVSIPKVEELLRAHILGKRLILGNDVTEDNVTLLTDTYIHNPADSDAAKFIIGDLVLATSYEVDGIRIVGYNRTSMIRQVPKAVESIFGLASFSPAAMLFEATNALSVVDSYNSCDLYDRDVDANADDSIQALVSGDDVIPAVTECLEVAEHFLKSRYQQVLLYVASYGKRFLPLTPEGGSLDARRDLADRFVETCKLCRVCSTVGKEHCMVLTPMQLRVLTPRVLINRLLYHENFFVASKLAEIVGIPQETILVHWAKSKIRLSKSEETDDQIFGTIRSRIKTMLDNNLGNNFPYATVAACAAVSGRMKVALQLGQLERDHSSKVLLLLKINEYERAIKQVSMLPDCDPDLFAYVVVHCVRMVTNNHWKAEDLFRTCQSYPRFKDLLVSYLRENDPKLYGSLLKHQKMFKQRGLLLAEAACMTMENFREKMRLLAGSTGELEKDSQVSLCKLSLEQARLWEMQHSVADSLVGTSLVHTVLDCFKRNNEELGQKFSTEFKMKPKTFRRLQLSGLAFCKNWTRMRELSEDKQVMRYLTLLDFVHACMKNNNDEEAVRYVEQLEDSEDKAYLLMRLKRFTESLECAYTIGDMSMLLAIRSSTSDDFVVEKVNKRLEMLLEQKAADENANAHTPVLSSTRSRGLSAVTDSIQDKAGCAQQ